MDNNYKKILISENIEKKDTLESISTKYYNEEIYSYFYQDINEYINDITIINNLSNATLTPFQDIKIPVIVNKDNIYLERIDYLSDKISKLEHWIQYKIEDKDTLSSLAYEGAGDIDESYSIIENIINKNHLKSQKIKTGSVIYIINPEIGYLKREIFQLTIKLKYSLKINNKK